MLTVSTIRGLKPKDKPYYEWDTNSQRGRGKLGVQVTPKGSKRFVFRYFVEGKAKFIPLGQFPELTLNDARNKQKELGELLIQGVDPKEYLEAQQKAQQQAKREESRKGSLKQLFDAYVAQMEKDGKRTHKAVLASLEKEVYPHIPPETKAKDVTKEDVKFILAAMIRRGAKTQSNRVRSYLMAAFNYGLKHDDDPANYIDEATFGLDINPVAGIPKQKDAERVGEHYLKLGEVMALIDDLNNEYQRFKMGESIRNLILLCLFTGGQRPYELAASKWEAIDWQQKTLLITADISKNKRPHIIPLTDSALVVLQKQQFNNESAFIFPHRFNTGEHIRLDSLSQGIARYRESTPEIKPFTPRDLRRTCKTLMGELGISKDIRDRLQNHALNDVSSKHYDRYEYLPEKRRALEVWEQKLSLQTVDNVLAFKG
ncbi:integrase arm-type DNA-binding domain-containing protein [Vibrio parahaemolyticus]|uniref:tyrosine-type recombinase/integrase n=1 Tax=Vibrio parahaemolyticus TaxID=670 RepID=UPI001B835525|nr:site-specific integrase [Vibrio parahaemolyticus]EGQ7972279.1 integrase arm-type DNA-binding domain-containing protein [Vibrio parahaemolyticus]MCR9808804.1 integrase arm-type DNA-binding domain-containing protein [Vibrio parahaemolyticus]MCR9954057.1 integrase arm-type DNA-binding domain-containing protein [Vibrio parahaemolyticus]HBC3590851.1 integrase arm-type DNA-binding domain-containing protein [Vibrio parahaemolyticus]HBC3914124.1 integrase arm-type DNA-binding domain-containing prot